MAGSSLCLRGSGYSLKRQASSETVLSLGTLLGLHLESEQYGV